LPIRRSGFSPDYAVTTAGIYNSTRSTGLLSPASAQAERLPNKLRFSTVFWGIGSRLSPVYFRGPQPRWVSCYAFFKGWLLLSLPPHCLRRRTPFCFTLSLHLGTLTPVWVASLSAVGAYPPVPVSRGLRRRWIRSLKGKWGLSTPRFSISALPHRLPRSRLCCDILRKELAITELDWSFAPSPRSEDRIARQNPFGPPSGLRLTSPCPGLDRPVSSFTTMTPDPFRPRSS
jgi:hypothetical protein